MNAKRIKKTIIRQLIEIAAVFAFSGLVTYAFMGNSLFFSHSKLYKGLLFGFCIGYSLLKVNQLVGFITPIYAPWEKNPKKTILISLALSTVFNAVDVLAVYYLYALLVFNTNIFGLFGQWVWPMAITFLIALVINMSFHVAHFFKWWRIVAINEERLKQEAIQLRYDALKGQVNPHFLFNSLSVLSSLIDTDQLKAKQFIQQFSDIYRYVLDQKDKELVALDDEIRFVKSYINLHRMRHGESLRVSIAIDDSSGYIVPLSLQTLLENCFKHNIVSEDNPLTVRLWRENGFVIVENNLQKRRTLRPASGIGLKTIGKQYEYLSERHVEVVQGEESFTVRIPIITSAERI